MHECATSRPTRGEGQPPARALGRPQPAAAMPDLERARGEHVREEGGPAARPPALLEGLSVLVVDDEEDARELIAAVLGAWGAAVDVAASAAGALERLRAHTPDVLVSDIAMPGEDGYVLLERIRALPVSEGGLVPAVALTAYARSEDRARALAAGFTVHVAKPVDPSALARVVARVAGRGEG